MRRQNKNIRKKQAQKPTSRNPRYDNKEMYEAAHDAAMHDIEEDPDFTAHSPNDDLDEGESARLGEDKTDLV